MYNKALSLYFIPPFEQFSNVFFEGIQAGLLAHGNFIWYKIFITFTFSRAIFPELILTTEEVITATLI